MSRKHLLFWIVFWSIGILLGSVAGYLLTQGVKTGHKWSQENKIKTLKRQEPVYSPTPFYFPYKARATSMYSTLPFSYEQQFRAQHNSQGYRTPEYTTAHPPNTLRILSIGDSCTWGQGVKMEETYSYLAERLLRPRCSGFQIQVIAQGVCGHRTADHLIKLLVQAPALKPDLVVIQAFANDVDFYDYLSIYQFQRFPDPVATYSAKENEIYHRGTMDREVFSEALQQIKKWSVKNNIPVVFLVFPPISLDPATKNMNHYDPSQYSGLVQFTEFKKVIDEIKNTFPTLYLIDTFREKAGDRYLAVSATDAHPNALGHQLAAEALVDFLVDKTHTIECSAFHPQKADDRWAEESKIRQEAQQHWDQYHLNYAKQVLLYQKLQHLYPENPWITMELATAYNKDGKWKESYDTFGKLLELAPEISAPWFHMAQNVPDKIELLETMQKHVPDHVSTLTILADTYLEKNEVQKACPILKHLIEIPQSLSEYDRTKLLYEKRCKSL